jgi:iron(III) transport system permease protein
MAQETAPIPATSGSPVSGLTRGLARLTGRARHRPGRDLLACLAVAIAAGVALPILAVLASLFVPATGAWTEAAAITLPRYIINTAALVLGVGAGSLIVGAGAAWLVTGCRFPARGLCQHLLLLPLGVPAYLLAYTYADLLQFSGPVQSALREWFGLARGEYWFPPIRSLGGAIAVLTFVLYPYVYLLARTAFLEQPASFVEASRGLGYGPWRSFAFVTLPLARPAIVAGLGLVAMETLADYGTVKHFEVNTFSTGIYQTWFGFGSPVGAAQLASGLLAFVFLVLLCERMARGRRRYHNTAQRHRVAPAYTLTGLRGVAAFGACLIPPLVGFFVPGGALLSMALGRGDPAFGGPFVRLAANSFALAAVTAVVAAAAALVIAYGLRLVPGQVMRLTARLATLGYAAPGVVVAVGVMLLAGRIDNTIDAWLRSVTGVSSGLLLSGTLAMLIFAYLVRFLAVAFGPLESGLTRIKPTLDEAARGLGEGSLGTLRRVHGPMLRGSLLTAALLVFVDTLKELPATLVLRPFNFDTLAVRVYRLASDERLAEASTAALTIVAVGLLPVALLSVTLARGHQGPASAGALPVVGAWQARFRRRSHHRYAPDVPGAQRLPSS